MVVRASHSVVAVFCAAWILAPRLAAQPAQRPADSLFLARQLVERARQIANRADTAADQHALALLDTAERVARIAPLFRLRALVSLDYGERLLARAQTTRACPDGQRAAQVVALAETAMPMDDLSNDPRLPGALKRLARLRDSTIALQRRACRAGSTSKLSNGR